MWYLPNLSCRWNGIPGVYHKLMFLTRYNPDVIFLQEVIPPYCSYLKKRASSYEIITGNNIPAVVFFLEKQVSERDRSKLACWTIDKKKHKMFKKNKPDAGY